MFEWAGKNIRKFNTKFTSYVEMDGGLTLNNILNYAGTDGKYLVLDENGAIAYRTVAEVGTDATDAASTTVSGIVELATSAETNTGTDTGRAVTPDGLEDWEGSAQVTTLGTIATGVWNGTAVAHTYIGADAIETDNIANAQVTVAKLHADAVQTASEIASSFGDNDTSLLTAAAVDDRIRVTSKHVLRCNSLYLSNNPLVQNSLYFGSSVGNTPWNWNDPAAVGGAISSTSSFTIIGDDENWGICLPVDISKIEVQCSLRPSGSPGAIDFSLAVYTGVRSSDSDSDLTLTKIGHQSVSFNSGNQRYKQNDLTIDTLTLSAGTMIYVGVGTEDAPNGAKQARGYMNITVTER